MGGRMEVVKVKENQVNSGVEKAFELNLLER